MTRPSIVVRRFVPLRNPADPLMGALFTLLGVPRRHWLRDKTASGARSRRRRDWFWTIGFCVILFELSFFAAAHVLQAAGFYRWLGLS